MAAIIAVAAHRGQTRDRGPPYRPSEAAAFLSDFLKASPPLAAGVNLFVSDAHDGLKAAISALQRLPGSAAACLRWRTRSSYVTKGHRAWSPVPAPAFLQPGSARPPRAAFLQVPIRSEQVPPSAPAFIDESETDVLNTLTSPPTGRNPSPPDERLNEDVKRPRRCVGIFPQRSVDRRLVGAVAGTETTIGRFTIVSCRSDAMPNLALETHARRDKLPAPWRLIGWPPSVCRIYTHARTLSFLGHRLKAYSAFALAGSWL